MATAVKKSARAPRLSRADQKIKRTEELLDAAWALFSEKGYEATTMDEVAEYAGVSRYPVYYAFGDKQNLFLELWKKEVRAVLDKIESRISRRASLRANLQALAQWAVDEHGAKPYGVDGLFYVVQTISLSRPDITGKLQAQQQDIIDFIAAIIETSTLPKGQQLRDSARNVAIQVIALVNGLANMRSAVQKVSVNTPDLLETFLTITTRRGG